MSKKNIFDFLEDSEQYELEMIERLTPELSDDQFERILKMSKRKKNIMRKAEEKNIRRSINNEDTVSGVERYKRPAWIKPLAAAASFVLLCGGIGFGFNLIRKMDTRSPLAESSISSEPENVTTTVNYTTISVPSRETVPAVIEITTTTADSEESAQTTTTTSVSESEYKAECEAWINNKVEKRDEALELIADISDHLDMNDTFTVNVHDKSDYTVRYARYTNSKFSSLDEIRDFYIDNYLRFLTPDWEYNGLDMDSHYVERYFDTRVQPEQQIQHNSRDKNDIIPLFTEYNGKIYKKVSEGEMMTDAEYWAQGAHGILWCFAVGNCTEDSFDLYEFYPEDLGCSYVIPCVKEDGEWKMLRESGMSPMSEELWQELYEKYQNGSSDIIIH